MISNDATRVTGRGAPMIATLDDIQAEVWHLLHLLEATRSALLDMDYERDGKRMHDLDQIAGLNCVACHFVEAIATGIDQNYQAIKSAAQGQVVQP